MKKFIIGMVLDTVLDMLIKVLEKSAMRTSSKVDDKLVATIINERDQITKEIKQHL